MTVNTHLQQISRELQLPAPETLSPASIVHTRAMGTTTVGTATPLTPASLTHTRAMGSPTVTTAISLSPASLTHTRAMGAPHINPTIRVASIVHTREMGDAEVIEPVVGTPDAATASTPDSFFSIAF